MDILDGIVSPTLLPSDYGLPHDSFRPHQLESIEWLLGRTKAERVIFVAAPTGSGKTSYAAALAARGKRVISLSKTKLLQIDNYGSYGFVYLFGRPNYDCPVSGLKADFCEYPLTPSHCDKNEECPYLLRKAEARRSSRMALNYAYFMTADWPKDILSDYPDESVLVADECHLLSDLVIERSSVTIRESDRVRYDLPPFPIMFDSSSAQAHDWLSKCFAILDNELADLLPEARGDPSLRKSFLNLQELVWRVSSCIYALQTSKLDWFMRSGVRGRELPGNRFAPGFVCKPLTAKHTFAKIFLHGAPVILMSATIGNFATFARELGINDYKTLRVPPVWPPDTRPVYYFEDCPRIGYRSSHQDLERQADLIASAISSVPDNWSGVIHCTSYNQVKSMANRLGYRGLGHRIWVPPAGATDRQLSEWRTVKKTMRGPLAISCTWWVGVDLWDSRIVINGKTPYPYIGDSYSRARMKYDGAFYKQRTAWRLQQGSGRTRRGRAEDYDIDGQMAGLVLIADGNWRGVQKYLDDDFRQSLTPWPT